MLSLEAIGSVSTDYWRGQFSEELFPSSPFSDDQNYAAFKNI
jgi:hypothetical protein